MTVAQITANIPAHVPADLVFDCPVAERKVYYEDVFATRITNVHHETPPIFWCPTIYPDGSGAWAVRRVADLKDVLADDDLFTTRDFTGFARMIGESWDVIPNELAGDRHTKFRKVLNPVFTPQKMFALDKQVRQRAAQFISTFEKNGECEFIRDFAVPFPVSIFLDLFGLPQEEIPQFLDWEYSLLHTPHMEERMAATRTVKAYLLDAIKQRRKKPTEDWISQALAYEIDGKPWSDDEIFGYCFNLYLGGLDTVTANLGNQMHHLANNVAQQEELRADPSKLVLAIEEMLRAYAAVTTFRTVTRDVEFKGVTMKAGDKVAVSTTMTSRDPEAWDSPGEIRFDRRPNHLTFGSAIHRCIGMSLARRELQIAIEQMLKQLPTFRIDPKQPTPFWLGSITKVQTLSLVWEA
jgi:cytochrome P450